MLRICWWVYENGFANADIAESADVAPETLSRIINGKQAPGYGEGQSAERIARAVGWTGDIHELFAEMEVS